MYRTQQTVKGSSSSNRRDSNLTVALKDTILNDVDAAKVMTDDIDKIVALQISPDVIANYQFKNYAAMRRLLGYGTDINSNDTTNKNGLILLNFFLLDLLILIYIFFRNIWHSVTCYNISGYWRC